MFDISLIYELQVIWYWKEKTCQKDGVNQSKSKTGYSIMWDFDDDDSFVRNGRYLNCVFHVSLP